MFTDYYKVLEVSSDADLDAIKRAYRKRAMQCHPDCGGSHEQMLLINEAFQILSNTETRSRYDAAQSGRSSRQAETDRERAQENAGNYPRDWTSFQTWLDAIYNDFAHENYDPGQLTKSISGSAFKIIGIVSGIAVALGILWAISVGFDWDPDSSWWGRSIFRVFGAKMAMVFVGAALVLHKVIRDAIRQSGSRPQQRPQENQNNGSDSSRKPVIPCPQCTQKLRVPVGRNEVRLRCTRCGHQFVHSAGFPA